MPETLEPGLALVAGIVAAVAVRQLAVARPGVLLRSHPALVWAVVAASALGAAVAPVSPTGLPAVDTAYKMAVAVVVTVAAGRARRAPRLLAGAAAAIGSAGAWPWNVVAFAALGLATGSTATRRPARTFATVVGALQVQVLLRLSWPDISYATAALAGGGMVLLVVSGWRNARRRERRAGRVALGTAGGLGLVAAVLLVAGVAGVQGDLRDGAASARAGFAAAKAGETGEAREQLERADQQLSSAADGLHASWLSPGRLLPVAGRYLDVSRRLTAAAASVVDPALESARLADGDALQITGARIDLQALAALQPPLERTLAAVPGVRTAVHRLEGEVLPGAVSRRLRDLDATLADATDDGETLLRTLDLVPQLLGANGPRRWFVVMQTPSEQRASGGIAGGYGELVVDDGHLELVRAGEGGELNQPGVTWHLGPTADEYARFAGNGPERYFSNVTNSPHFPTVGRTIVEVYPQAGGAPVDGVISVDPRVLAAFLSLTGPIDVSSWPGPITADNVERTLLYEQYLLVEGGTEGRQFITDVIEATFDRLRSTTLPPPAQVLRTLSPVVQANRLMLYSTRSPEQSFFEDMGIAGAMPDVEGDFLQLVTLNNSANKIDWFQQRALTYDVDHDPATGEVDAVATIAITNEAPSQGLSDLLLGGLSAEPGPPGRSRTTVDLWTALELQGATVDDRPVRMSGTRSNGRNLYWTTLIIQPGQTAALEVHLTGLLDPGEPYVLDLGMQPVIRPDHVQVEVAVDDPVSVEGLVVRDGVASVRFDQVSPRRFEVRDGP